MAKRGRKAKVTKTRGKKRAGRRAAGPRLDQIDIRELQAALDRRKQELADERARLLARVQEIDQLIAGRKPRGRPGRPPKVSLKPGPKPGRKPGPKPGRKPGPKPGRKPGPKPKARKVRGGMTLGNKLDEILGSVRKPMAVRELLAAVQASDYPSKSKHLRSMVNQTLSNDPRFRKVSRGFYRLA